MKLSLCGISISSGDPLLLTGGYFDTNESGAGANQLHERVSQELPQGVQSFFGVYFALCIHCGFHRVVCLLSTSTSSVVLPTDPHGCQLS